MKTLVIGTGGREHALARALAQDPAVTEVHAAPGNPGMATVATLQKVARAVKDGMKADGLTIQQFNESAGGQVVFHLHFHVLPRWEGIALRPHTGAMAPKEELQRHAEAIRAALK